MSGRGLGVNICAIEHSTADHRVRPPLGREPRTPAVQQLTLQESLEQLPFSAGSTPCAHIFRARTVEP